MRQNIEHHHSNRLLIIEDDKTLSSLLAQHLNGHGYQTQECHDGLKGYQTAVKGPFDLILLDIMLPEMDGVSVLNKLRTQSQIPIIMLTAKGAEEDRITGLECGADDYLPKPFNITELLLRIDAVLRRSLNAGKKMLTSCINFENLRIDKSNNSLLIDEQETTLTSIEFNLLWLLLSYKTQVLSKQKLYQDLMARNYTPEDRSLDMHISKLRRKLRNAGFNAEYIRTIHGQGYSIR